MNYEDGAFTDKWHAGGVTGAYARRSEEKLIEEAKTKIVIIRGDSGSGKTAMLSYAYSRLREERKKVILLLNNSIINPSMKEILSNLVFRLRAELNKKRVEIPNHIKDLKSCATELIRECSAKNGLDIYIDDIDLLLPKDLNEIFSFGCDKCTFIVTSKTHLEISPELIHDIDYSYIDLCTLNKDAISDIVVERFEQFGLEAWESLTQGIANKLCHMELRHINLILNNLVSFAYESEKEFEELSIKREESYNQSMEKSIIHYLNTLVNKSDEELIFEYADTMPYGSDILKLASITRGVLTADDLIEVMLKLTADRIEFMDLIMFVRMGKGIFSYRNKNRVYASDLEIQSIVEKNLYNEDKELLYATLEYIKEEKAEAYTELGLLLLIQLGEYEQGYEFISAVDGNRDAYGILRREMCRQDKSYLLIQKLQKISEFIGKRNKQNGLKVSREFREGIFEAVSEAKMNYEAFLLEPVYNAVMSGSKSTDEDTRELYNLAVMCDPYNSLKDYLRNALLMCRDLYDKTDIDIELHSVIQDEYYNIYLRMIEKEKLLPIPAFVLLKALEAQPVSMRFIFDNDKLRYTIGLMSAKKYQMMLEYMYQILGTEDFEKCNLKYCQAIERDLLSVVRFCEKSEKELAVAKEDYKNLYVMANTYLAFYFSMMGNMEKSRKYAFIARMKAYSGAFVDKDPKTRLVLGCLNYVLGKNSGIPHRERIKYLKEAGKIAIELNEKEKNSEKNIEKINAEIKALFLVQLEKDKNGENLELWSDYFSTLSDNKASLSENGVILYTVDTLNKADELFKEAFDKIGDSKYEAYEKFSQLLDYGKSVLKFYKSFIKVNYDEESLKLILPYMAMLSNRMWKACHNLKLLDDENWEKWLEECNYYASETLFAIKMFSLVSDDKEKKEALMGLMEDGLHRGFTYVAIAEVKLYAYCIDTENYCIKYEVERSLKDSVHWYNMYQLLRLEGDREIIKCMDKIGERLCKYSLSSIYDRVLGESNFIECIALEYAYKKGDYEKAHMILNNGYDYYLEMGTLYIMREYDYELYKSKFSELKRICLKRRIREIKKSSSWDILNPIKLYGYHFTDELKYLCKKALEQIDPNDTSDYRNRDERKIP